MTAPQRPRRSLMFVPATRPDRFEKAVATGADIVCVDWEDAVAFGAKAEAREAAKPFFAGASDGGPSDGGPPGGGPLKYLRINCVRTIEGLRDLLTLAEWSDLPDGLLVPKVGSPEEIRWVEGIIAPVRDDIELMPLIESAEGIRRVHEILKASPRIKIASLGSVDLATETGSDHTWETMLYARTRLVHAATEAGIDCMDTVWIDTEDLDGLKDEVRRAAALGLTGKAAIYPTQVGPINEAFSPTQDAIDQARRIVAAAEASDYTGAAKVDGIMIDEPVVYAARRTLAVAERL